MELRLKESLDTDVDEIDAGEIARGNREPIGPACFPTVVPAVTACNSYGITTLSDLLNEKASISPEMALRIEKAFGISMETLLRMQAWFDTVAMRERSDQIQVQRFIPSDATENAARRST